MSVSGGWFSQGSVDFHCHKILLSSSPSSAQNTADCTSYDFISSKRKLLWVSKMAQLVKVLYAKADNLSLVPRVHMVEGEN